jgi:serine/threonine-protein kinase
VIESYLAPGALLRGRYEIDREIGRGGYSVVYRARDRELGSAVAIKLLVPPPAAAQLARERMRREVQAVRRLSHANIVAVFDFLEEGPWSFIVMEYVAGPDLSIRVRDRGPLAAAEAGRLGREIAAALSAAHGRGNLHRDVKPQNILMDPEGRARLTDFGSAKLEDQLGVTATGALAGTLAYAPPEALAGQRGDARGDVYGLGLTLHFALTGENPVRAPGPLPPEPAPDGYRPGALASGIPPWLDQVVARATSAAPERRFPTAAALEEALVQGAETGLARAEAAPAPACILCGGPDPLGIGFCPACGGGSAAVADTLIFLRPPIGPDARRSAASRLAGLLPVELGSEARQAAVTGGRPLFKVAQESAPRVLERLERQSLPARAVPAARPLSAAPGGFVLLLGSVVIAGEVAGVAVLPMLLWTTPLVGVVLVVAAHRSLSTPLLSGRRRRSGLPARLERQVLASLAELPPGPARSLLSEMTRAGDDLLSGLERSGDDRRLAQPVGELTSAACGVAADLARLDQGLAGLERQRARLPSLPADWLDALAGCERSRDALMQRLLEGLAVLVRLQRQTAGEDSSGSGLAEATRQLEAEAAAQAAAAAELARLLASPGESDSPPAPRPAGESAPAAPPG